MQHALFVSLWSCAVSLKRVALLKIRMKTSSSLVCFFIEGACHPSPVPHLSTALENKNAEVEVAQTVTNLATKLRNVAGFVQLAVFQL